MNTSQISTPLPACYELRYTDLYNNGRGFAFACDAEGNVKMDELSALALVNYRTVCTLVGKELSLPVIRRAIAT